MKKILTPDALGVNWASMIDKNNENKPPFSWGIFAIGSGVVLVICLAFPWLTTWLKWAIPSQGVPHAANEIGDMFGALNTCFTGLAFVGLVVTLLMQRHEMKEAQARHESQMALQKDENVTIKMVEEERKSIENVRFAEGMVFKYYEAIQRALDYYDSFIRKQSETIVPLPSLENLEVSFQEFMRGVSSKANKGVDMAVVFKYRIDHETFDTSYLLYKYSSVIGPPLSVLNDAWTSWVGFVTTYVDSTEDQQRVISRLWGLLLREERFATQIAVDWHGDKSSIDGLDLVDSSLHQMSTEWDYLRKESGKD